MLFNMPSRALLHAISISMTATNAACFQLPFSLKPTISSNNVVGKSSLTLERTTSFSTFASIYPRHNLQLFMGDENDKDESSSSTTPYFERKPYFINKEMLANKEEETRVDSSSTTMVKDPPPTIEPANALAPGILKALEEAHAMKKRAKKERLEAERMATTLQMEKISLLESELNKLQKKTENANTENNEEDLEKKIRANEKKQTEVKSKILNLRKQLSGENSNETPKAPITVTSDIDEVSIADIDMPKDLYNKRVGAYKGFSPEVRSLFARAVKVNESEKDDAETVIKKAYVIEQKRIKEGNKAPLDLLDLANAQAGYDTLPPPVQEMVAESVGVDKKGMVNATAIVEKLIDKKRVKRTDDGGVEFAMDDPESEESRGLDRDFTKEEIKSAESLYEGLPMPMKLMLSKSIGVENETNTTKIVARMIEEKKLLPAEDGVEFVVFGNAEDGGSLDLGDLEGAAYVRSLLPSIVTNDKQTPSKGDVDAFFSEVLTKKNFKPRNKPELVPGGYIIRGENMMKTGDELVSALEEKMKTSSVAGKLNFYFIKDPTPITQEDFDSDMFELPVLMVSGTNLFPTTNRFVKPVVTALGGISIASFAVAVCLSTDLSMDLNLVEEMTGPLVFAVISTQIMHELAHQVVALKDEFKAGAPTIVPSLQLGLQGCITPINSPPPNLNSLFDFAISGPLVGILISLLLMYSGLEQQVFMDPIAQASLPSLPVDLVRSSSLAGGMVEWLLGDGTLVSAGPESLIRLHPFAIAGFVGIVSNALNLLPVGNTDGGRVATSIFGRSFAKFIRGTSLVLMVGAGFFGGDQANVLLFFAIFAQIWQKEPAIPCKNEVDGVSDFRAIAALATLFLVGAAVIPLPI
mmetsp:Transcript_16099/g.24126  ORF Transcript_16099/g.24126 Transcript_16099/m.24126 type:complete len:866 (-) Transcript_16099:22-2619(-)